MFSHTFLTDRGLQFLIKLSLTLQDVVSSFSDLDQIFLSKVWANTQRLWILILHSDG